jgi:hypothetical protein
MTNMPANLRSVANQDGAAILDARRGTISTLNATGAYVWRELERGESVEQIVASLARETEMSIDAVERDVQAFVEALRGRDLLSR